MGSEMCIRDRDVGWWASRLGGRPSRELCSLEMAPVERVGRPAESSALCIQSRSTGPVDRRHNGQKSDHCASGRPGLDTESSSSLPIDRPGRPGPFPESRALWTVDRPVDRSTSLGCVHVLCTSVDRTGRLTSASVDRQTARSDYYGD